MSQATRPAQLARSVLGQLLHGIGERSAEVIGGAYAQLAASVLARGEQLEDRRAERRYQRHAHRTKQPPTLSAQ